MSTILARTIDNNYIYADRSDKDGNGNNIASTYATQASVSAIRQVPAAAAADENKVLGVTDAQGSVGWVQGGGSSVSAGSGIEVSGSTVSIKPVFDDDGYNVSGLGLYDSDVYYSVAGTKNDTTISSLGSSCFYYPGIGGRYGGGGFNINGPFTYFNQSGVYLILAQCSDWSEVDSSTPYAVAWNPVDFVDGVAFLEGGFGSSSFQELNNFDLTAPFLMVYANTNIISGLEYLTSYETFTWSGQLDWANAGLVTSTVGVVKTSGVFVDVPAVKQQMNLSTVASTGSYNDLANLPTIPTVPTAGNMLSTTNNVLNVTTTAGITDVQLVQSMPASPVATVLYLIPEN